MIGQTIIIVGKEKPRGYRFCFFFQRPDNGLYLPFVIICNLFFYREEIIYYYIKIIENMKKYFLFCHLSYSGDTVYIGY